MKCLARQMQQDRRILAGREQQHRLLGLRDDFTEDVDAFCF
jgi:hypothetical protein